MKTNGRKELFFESLIEIIISIIPLVIIFCTLLYIDKEQKFFSKPEWSFASVIFFGQSLVKIIISAINSKRKISAVFTVLVVCLIIVLGLLPANSILVFIISENENGSPIPTWTKAIQVIIFLFSVVSYIFANIISGELLGLQKD